MIGTQCCECEPCNVCQGGQPDSFDVTLSNLIQVTDTGAGYPRFTVGNINGVKVNLAFVVDPFRPVNSCVYSGTLTFNTDIDQSSQGGPSTGVLVTVEYGLTTVTTGTSGYTLSLSVTYSIAGYPGVHTLVGDSVFDTVKFDCSSIDLDPQATVDVNVDGTSAATVERVDVP